jgi:hypothetical protein
LITSEDVKGLLTQADGQAVLSLYLSVNNAVRENQADPPAWRIWLKRTLRELANGTSANHWRPIQERAAAYFEHYSPTSKGVIAFFGDDWEQVYALPVALENQGGFGELLLEPLLRILSEYQPYLVVQVSREDAHFYISLLGQTEFQDSLEIDLEDYDFAQKTLMPATAALIAGDGGLTQGSNRDAYDDMIEAHRARFYRDVVDYTQKLMRTRQVQRVILGGSEQAAHAVHNQMPEALRKQVIAIESLPGHFGTHEIFTHVQPQALAYEQAQAAAEVDDVINKARAGGRAVLGPEAVQHALERQQVETLFLSDQLSDKDLANDLVGRTLNINSEVKVLFGPAAEKLQAEAGGVAARLYYAL